MISKKTIFYFFGFILFLFRVASFSFAEDYYVSPTGTATWANCGGAKPLNGSAACSWQTAMSSATAGDVVYFRGGTYDLGTFANHLSMKYTKMYPVNSGTAGNPITFIAYPGEVPDITGTVTSISQEAWFGCGGRDDTENRNYITWDGFIIAMQVNNVDPAQHYETAVFRVAGDHCTIRNSKFTGVDVGNWPFNTAFVRIETATNALIENNYFHGLTSVPFDATNTGAIYFNMLSNSTTVRNNTIENCEGGILGKGNSANVDIYNNFIINSTTTGYKGIWYTRSATTGELQTTRRVYQNIVIGYSAGIWFENNANNTNVTGSLVYNNTIYSSNGTDDGIYIDHTFTNTEVFNNILYNRNPFLRYDDNAVSYSNNNLFYGSGFGGWNCNFGHNGTLYSSLLEWTSSNVPCRPIDYDNNSVTINPNFVNAGGKNPVDYRLQMDSTARTGGRGAPYSTVMGAYITGNEVIGYVPPHSTIPNPDSTPPVAPKGFKIKGSFPNKTTDSQQRHLGMTGAIPNRGIWE